MKYSLERPITAASLLRFSLPTIISMIFMGIYTTIDGVFVSQLIGTDALSSVNIIMPVANAAIAVGTMFGTGGNAIVAKRLGEGREQTARENFSLILITAAIVGLIFTVAGLIFINPLVFFLGSDQSLYTYCYDYALYTLLFVPACVFAMIFQVFFITAGHAGLGLSFSIAGGLSNIVLDYVLIHMYSWGIKGAAVATGISYTIPSLAGFAYFAFYKKNQIHICRPKFHWNVIQKACLNGASEMVTNLSMSVVTLLFNLIMMEFAGSDGVASVTIILYSQYLMSCVYLGYAVGIAPIISYNYGRRDTNRLKKLFRLSLIIITIASIMTFTTSLIFASPLVAIFSSHESRVYKIAVYGFRLFSTSFLFMGFNIYGSAMFTALSDGITSAVLSLLRTLVFVILAVILLPKFIGMDGVWFSIPMAELLGLFVTFFLFWKKKAVYHYA